MPCKFGLVPTVPGRSGASLRFVWHNSRARAYASSTSGVAYPLAAINTALGDLQSEFLLMSSGVCGSVWSRSKAYARWLLASALAERRLAYCPACCQYGIACSTSPASV